MAIKKDVREGKFELYSFLGGAVIGALIGSLGLLVYQYLLRIFTQPRLLSRVVLTKMESFDDQESRALFIAAENLRSGVEKRRLQDGSTKQILHAGYRNFRESWGRDFGFAAYGLLTLREFEAVRETLEAFLLYQQPSGQLPVKLHSTSILTRYLHALFARQQPIDAILRPKYLTGHRTDSLDGQSLLIIAASMYMQTKGENEFIRAHWNPLVSAMRWLESYDRGAKDHLLRQEPYADWADTIARRGKVLYTNVVYWKALTEMAHMAEKLEYRIDQSHYQEKADRVGESIQREFWRADLGYFITSNSMPNFSSGGNLLAVAWGLASEQQAAAILDLMRDTGMADPVPTKAASPPYARRYIAIENRLGGIANYHTDAAWLWLGSWHVIALVRVKRLEEAKGLLGRMADVIVRDGEVHEVYGPDGEYLKNFWYTSEAPLIWNAGMVVYAYRCLESHLREHLQGASD